MKKNKNYFKYVVLVAVLVIPFMYSFFYLKAYWNPYGDGNIDNIPVAIVNEDQGDMGEELINGIKETKKLKLSIVSSSEAEDGLYNKEYYAVITIPESFTSDMESAATNNKKHATITYSPNQKSNYLASQIINTVVLNVEMKLDNQVNSFIISNLSNTIKSVPDELSKVSDGFVTMENGTKELQSGSETLASGTNTLKENYDLFNNGVGELKNGVDTLKSSTSEFSNLSSGLNELVSGTNKLASGSNQFTSGFNNYITGVDTTLEYSEILANYINVAVCPKVQAGIANDTEIKLCMIASSLTTEKEEYANNNTFEYLKVSGSQLQQGNNQVNSGLNSLNTSVNEFTSVDGKITELQEGIEKLSDGANTLYDSSLQIQSGINSLNTGVSQLNAGISELHDGVTLAHSQIDNKIDTLRSDIKVVDDLAEYANNPVTIETEEVNKVSSYGTAFSPFFISIALWVGCLMMFIVLYYDKDERFKILGINNKKRVQRTLCYHVMATLSGLVLGILLQIFLDFEITNIFLYYISIILTANAFMGIIEFLIINFKDIGKFIALILLVLQLAASGGTFPIETVTIGFRWMNNFLPMKYTINLFREALISIEGNILTQNILVIIIIFVIFLGINIISDIIRQKKENK